MFLSLDAYVIMAEGERGDSLITVVASDGCGH